MLDKKESYEIQLKHAVISIEDLSLMFEHSRDMHYWNCAGCVNQQNPTRNKWYDRHSAKWSTKCTCMSEYKKTHFLLCTSVDASSTDA